MALHAGDQITAIKGKNEICHCTGEGSSGCQGLEGTGQARESAVRYFVIIIFSLFLLGYGDFEAVPAGLHVFLSWMQRRFVGRSRLGATEVMLGGWYGVSPPGKAYRELPSQGFGIQVMGAVMFSY